MFGKGTHRQTVVSSWPAGCEDDEALRNFAPIGADRRLFDASLGPHLHTVRPPRFRPSPPPTSPPPTSAEARGALAFLFLLSCSFVFFFTAIRPHYGGITEFYRVSVAGSMTKAMSRGSN